MVETVLRGDEEEWETGKRGRRAGHLEERGRVAGHHDIADALALPGPAGDGGRRAELQVVGVGDDAEGAAPALVEGLEGLGPVHVGIVGRRARRRWSFVAARGTSPSTTPTVSLAVRA